MTSQKNITWNVQCELLWKRNTKIGNRKFRGTKIWRIFL